MCLLSPWGSVQPLLDLFLGPVGFVAGFPPPPPAHQPCQVHPSSPASAPPAPPPGSRQQLSYSNSWLFLWCLAEWTGLPPPTSGPVRWVWGEAQLFPWGQWVAFYTGPSLSLPPPVQSNCSCGREGPHLSALATLSGNTFLHVFHPPYPTPSHPASRI